MNQESDVISISVPTAMRFSVGTGRNNLELDEKVTISDFLQDLSNLYWNNSDAFERYHLFAHGSIYRNSSDRLYMPSVY
jgi:hypothetical protein